jgi:hypothetical protein
MLPTLQDNELLEDSILPCVVKEVVEEEEAQEEAEVEAEAQHQHHLLPTLQLQSLQLLTLDPWVSYQQSLPEIEPKHKISWMNYNPTSEQTKELQDSTRLYTELPSPSP